MKTKKRVQNIENQITQLTKLVYKIAENKGVKLKKVKKCRICGKVLPSHKQVYCSLVCAKAGDNLAHKKKYQAIRKKGFLKKKKVQGRYLWQPTKKEMTMLKNGKMTINQWQKYFGLKTKTGIYKKLGQMIMYIQDTNRHKSIPSSSGCYSSTS